MKKLYPRDYHLTIKEVGDHLEVHVVGTDNPLDLTVETEPGKTSHRDALDAAHLAVETSVLAEAEQQREQATTASAQ